ncbi:MAG: glycosyltransferase family 4 protein [Polyangiaceae bacterium]|jgi:glycosyltransferase involved in cell wall biosynthesis
MNRHRVMHVVVAGDIGGAERLLVDVATRPERTRAEHEVALFTPNSALREYFANAGLRVHDCGAAPENPIAYLQRSLGGSHVRRLADLLIARSCDIVHTHTFGSHVIGTRAAERTQLRQVRTEHHFVHYFDPSCRVFTRWAAARTAAIVAVSEYVRRVLERTAPSLAERTTVARNGVDTVYWSPREKTDRGFRACIVCRLTAWKRVHLAIRAAAMAHVELAVVGDGEQRGALERLARALSAPVRFVGYAPDPRIHICESDVVLSTSDREPLGLSVMEALSMGRPVVACAAGGIPEIVRDDETGILVPEGTAEGFARALMTGRDQPERLAAMAARGRAFAMRECSIESTCEKYGDVYDRVLRAS